MAIPVMHKSAAGTTLQSFPATSSRYGGCEDSKRAFECRSSGPGRSLVSDWKLRLRRESFVCGRREVYCRSSGGTRRDDAKIVARTNKRRSRHMKGVTPTKPELFEKLQAEEAADQELERFQASVESGIETDGDEDSAESLGDGFNDANLGSKEEQYSKALASNGNSTGNSDTDSKVPGEEEIVESGENTYTVKYYPEGKDEEKGAGKATQDAAEEVSGTIQGAATETGETVREAGDNVSENIESLGEDAREVTGEVSDVAEDTAEDVTNIGQNAATDISGTLQDAAQDLTSIAQGGEIAPDDAGLNSPVQEVTETRDNTYTVKYYPEGKEESPPQKLSGGVSNIAQSAGEDVASTAEDAADKTGKRLRTAGDSVLENVEELTDRFDSTVSDIRDTAEDSTRDVGKSLGEAGDDVLDIIEGQGEAGRSFRGGVDDAREQMQETRKETEETLSELGSQTEKTGDRAGKALETVSDEAEKSLQNVQESLSILAEDSARTAGTIRSEAMRLGEVVLSAAGEAIGFQDGTTETSTSNGNAAKAKQATEETKSRNGYEPEGQGGMQINGLRAEEGIEESKNLYKGLTVTVAGASGRTGRLLVEELVRKGVKGVRALVRDKSKPEAVALGRLTNVEVVQVNLYKYETIKEALGDSNVVISAIGARSFPFDPIGTYQAEFECVKNLVAAAKNKGNVKKFVFVTSLGVTFLQVIPLIFWKKQSELYLQRSGLDYTIVRPGGLTNEAKTREAVTMKPADTQFGGSISRRKVAEVCVASLVTPEASEKVVEVVTGGGASRSLSDLFRNV